MDVKFLKAEEVAERLGVRPDTIRHWARRGRIPCKKLGRNLVRFILSEVMAALESGK